MPRRKEQALFVRRLFDSSDESLVFDQSTGSLCIISAPTRIVWSLCNGRRTWEEIVEVAMTRTSLDKLELGFNNPEFGEEDLQNSLQALCDKNWVSLEDRGKLTSP